MGDTLIVIWSTIVGIVALNGFAAGIAAALHAWRRNMRRRSRVLTAATAAGLLPAHVMFLVLLAGGDGGEEAFVLVVAVGLVLAVGGVLSLPGAIVVARKLEAPGDHYRAFE